MSTNHIYFRENDRIPEAIMNAWAPSEVDTSSACPSSLSAVRHITGLEDEDAEEDWYDLNVTEVVTSTLENLRRITALETLMTSKVARMSGRISRW